MAEYRFVTRWFIPAEPGRVWDALNATDRYHEWWPNFVGYRSLTPGVTGVGARAERVVRGALPYRLRYTTTTTLMDAPREVAYDADGDLVGRGRFVLAPRDGGTEVTFAWNHNRVMARGERGLRRLLAGTGSGPSRP